MGKVPSLTKNVTSLLRPLLVASSLSPLPLPSSPSPSSPPPSLPSSWFCAQAPVPVAVLRRYASRLQDSEVDASREISTGTWLRQPPVLCCRVSICELSSPSPFFSFFFGWRYWSSRTRLRCRAFLGGIGFLGTLCLEAPSPILTRGKWHPKLYRPLLPPLSSPFFLSLQLRVHK